jgi:excinuclease UvrABC nuclease subunit
MFLVRNVFHAKPGKAKALVETFKKASPYMESSGMVKKTRIMTDTAASFWTVVVEQEVENLNDYMNKAKTMSQNEEFVEAVKGYTEYAKGGHREVFLIE